MAINNNRTTLSVLNSPIDVINFDQAIIKISLWSHMHESRYVCITNVHSVVTASQESDFASVLAAADLCTADGAPVAWLMQKLGNISQERLNGPDLMWKYCAHAEKTGEAIFLLGGEPNTLKILQTKLADNFPLLKIAGVHSPPFRVLTDAEDAVIVDQINSSGAGIVWISLGCPKQEKWMAAHRGRINAVMIGVGAAFDYHAGTIVRAPLWMQRNGLEWFHRLCSEPRRLWRRYLVTNSIFIIKASKQLIFK